MLAAPGELKIFNFGFWCGFLACAVFSWLTGCGAPEVKTPDLPDVKPGDNVLIKAAWDAWGMRGFDRPAIRYLEGAALNCDTDLGRGFLMLDQGAGHNFVPPGTLDAQCVLGLSVPDRDFAWVAWHGSLAGTTKKAIVHELCHFARTDDNHTGPCNPAPGGQIDQIAARL